jgi:ribosomal protein S18 acetylase RimI-like enzyme
MTGEQISYLTGVPEQYRSAAVVLYEEAFGRKLSLAVPDQNDRKRLLVEGFQLQYAVGAISRNGLLGIAGFHSNEGSLTGGTTYRDLVEQLGVIRGNRAAVVFSLYERRPQAGELVMDGISVRSDSRGSGIGSKLLIEIQDYAATNGYSTIRLDVIDSNPRAKQLYERMGFKTVKFERFPYLKGVLGFSGVITMMYSL